MDTLTLTEEMLDLEITLILTAADPHQAPCEATRHDCPNAALFRVFWKPIEVDGKPCYCGNQKLCLGCKDWTMNGYQPGDIHHCLNCGGHAELVRVEPIR